MAKDVAVVLCDGGLNGAVAATLAAQKHRLVMIYGDSGTGAQSGGSRRRAAYDQQVTHFKPLKDITVVLPPLTGAGRDRSGSALPIDPRAVVDIGPKLVELVPLVGLAARVAAHHQAAAVYVGLRVGPSVDDLARATEWVQIWTELLQLPGDLPDLEVVTPLLELEPWQIVDLAVQVGTPLERTWACERDAAEPCGICPGCKAREAAFEQAAKADPLRKTPR